MAEAESASDEELHDYDAEALAGTYFSPTNCFTNSLLKAVADGDIERVRKILKAGCDLNSCDARGYTALHLSIEFKRVDILKILVKQRNIRLNIQTNHGETPLFLSLENESNTEGVLTLINSGCNINLGNYEDVTPLHLAVRWKSTNVAHQLIKRGAKINAKDQDGYTPLHEAATKNQFTNVCMLLYYNASANEKTTFSQATPFHMSCNFQFTSETAKYLINYVNDINEVDGSGYTPLYIALNNVSDFAADLIRNGADVNVFVGKNSCLYLSLFYETSDVFEMMWNAIDCNILLEHSYSFLHQFLSKCKFPTKQFLKCFYMIFDSPHIEDLIYQYLTTSEESLFSRIAHKSIPLNERIEIFYLLMSLGVPVYFNDICLLHNLYGFDNSLEVILTSGCCIGLNRRKRFDLLASQIVYNNLDIYRHGIDYFTHAIYDSDRKSYYRFYTVPEVEEFTGVVMWRNVRTLLELARDAVRKFMYEKYQKPYMFAVYSKMKDLQVPKKIKDILFLKEPLYADCDTK